MDDISTLIWLGIAVIWFLTRLFRRGAKKVTQAQKRPPRPTVSRPTAPVETKTGRFESQRDFTGRGGKGPPPIVPR